MATKTAKKKQLGVDFFSKEEFEHHIRANRLSLPFRLEDVVFQINQATERREGSGDQLFGVFSMITLEQWKVMLNHTIVTAQKVPAK